MNMLISIVIGLGLSVVGILLLIKNKETVNFFIDLDITINKKVPLSLTRMLLKSNSEKEVKRMYLNGEVFGNAFLIGYLYGVIFTFAGIYILYKLFNILLN